MTDHKISPYWRGIITASIVFLAFFLGLYFGGKIKEQDLTKYRLMVISQDDNVNQLKNRGVTTVQQQK